MRLGQVIDTEKKGYIEAEVMRELLTTKGTPFREKEMEGGSSGDHRLSFVVLFTYHSQLSLQRRRTRRRDGFTMKTISPSSRRPWTRRRCEPIQYRSSRCSQRHKTPVWLKYCTNKILTFGASTSRFEIEEDAASAKNVLQVLAF
jgi:hypothetical protein